MRNRVLGSFRAAWIAAACVAALAPACTKSKLERIPKPHVTREDKVEVSGSICTADPESRVLPLRVLFVVDCSESMARTDPPDPVTGETGRETAVRDAWMRLIATNPESVRIGIIRFSAEAQGLTPVDTDGDGLPNTYFTADPRLLENATSQLANTDRTTNYSSALSEAYFEIRTELTDADEASLPLSRYIVIFLTDGLPDVDVRSELANSEDAILSNIDDLHALAELHHVGSFSFNTAYLASGGTLSIFDQQAERLLALMAGRGKGVFRSFPNGDPLNFAFVGFDFIRRIFTLRSLTILNTNTVTDGRQIAPYFDRPDASFFPDGAWPDGSGPDGDVPDAEADAGPEDAGEIQDAGPDHDANLDGGLQGPPSPEGDFTDIDNDTYPSCGEPLVDTDGDGLADWVERETGSNPFVTDTDDDGLGDRMEWAFRASGQNPRDAADSTCYVPAQCVDMDGDMACDCVIDLNTNGICDCIEAPLGECADAFGHDCVDTDMDGYCDCPDLNMDGLCDYADRDGDTVHDCEEVFWGTKRNSMDTDADGLSDNVELRAGANAAEDDRLDDIDWDRTPTGNEVVTGTDPWCDDSVVRSFVAYQFVQDTSQIDHGRACYTFRASNITLVPTAANRNAVYPGNGWNRILVYAAEVPFDDPSSTPSFRVACFMANYSPEGSYRNPPSGRVRLSSEDFVDVKDFDPDVHCIWP